VLRSSDNGTTWYNVNAGLTTGVHSLYNVGEYLFAGTNSGIYRRSFTDLADVSERKGISNLNLFLSPNPTTGIITIHNAPPNMLHVTITNVLGETASEVTNLGAPDFTIDLSKLHPGTYFARFTGEGEVLTRKILKE